MEGICNSLMECKSSALLDFAHADSANHGALIVLACASMMLVFAITPVRMPKHSMFMSPICISETVTGTGTVADDDDDDIDRLIFRSWRRCEPP
eukprot:CAMPEP_0198109916 /NCGR_PEP_ID=MMETSP1442-20131203/1953_1 /TAXON_ID= /ORGANISM="Craspedostauros australis, Strain CCMP3328" /LENGTH=93 /DNA_ID=CAMNT_0043765763 /DNA_START=38 /DNA_END=315 /DNA_ORIENTATION=-